jgi:hypothetical protein
MHHHFEAEMMSLEIRYANKMICMIALYVAIFILLWCMPWKV